MTLLTERYHYDFTYAHDAIRNVHVKTPSPSLSIEEVIIYLETETGLVFQFLENHIITINVNENNTFICGYLIDNETNTPIESVTVIGGNGYTISDSFGYFKLKVTGNENIIIRHLGYFTMAKFADSFDTNCSTIYLSPQIETLSEILLSNYITSGIDKLADGTISINFSNFGILPGLIEADVLQTVQALPGIQSVNETVSNINIRGGTNDQNLLLWDGIKMYQSGHFFGLISIFNPLTTSDASIIKNGSNTNLTDGVSGTIAMRTDTHINNAFKGSIGANFINVDAFADIPIGKKASLQLSTRKAVNDLLKNNPTYNKYFNRILQNTEVNPDNNTDITFDFYDASLRWLYDASDKDRIRINFLNVNNELEFTETGIINGNLESRESSLTQNSLVGGVFYRRKWNDAFVTTLQVNETYYELKAINAEVLRQRRLLQENEVFETSVQLNSWYQFNKKISFLNGYHFTETIVEDLTDVDNPVFLRFTKDVVREHAAFSQINYISNSKKTTVKAGMRYNYIEKFKKHIVEPRLSVQQKFLRHFNLEILGELKHQNTTQIINFQNDFLGVEKRRWLLSDNSDIPIITSKQASLGLTYANKGWLITTEGYFKEVKGITSQSQGFLNQYTFANTSGSYDVKGVDVLINKKFKKLSTWLSYSYADNQYTFKDLTEVNFPSNLDIRHTISFGTSYTSSNFKISTGFNWHSGKPSTKPLADNPVSNGQINYNAANSSRLKEYLRIDASAIYTFKLSSTIKAQSGISILNSFNHKNILNSHYDINNNTANKVSNKALLFTPNISFRVFF